MNNFINVLYFLGGFFVYMFVGAFVAIPIEWFIRQINRYAEIDDEDRWRFILLWPVLIVIGIVGFLGYFPFWLSKKLAKKAFKDKNS